MPDRILICDDCDEDVYLLSRSLTIGAISIQSVRARDGEEALQLLTEQTGFDLVIIDHRLPLKSGLEVLHDLRSAGKFPLCPVVVLTSRTGKEKEAMEALGVHSVLEKPISLDGYREIGKYLAKLCG